jgi:hypothetical protein
VTGEAAMTSTEELRQIKKRAEKTLLKLPGVTGVALGHKTVAGLKTDVPAIVVYVEHKRDVTGADRIPASFEGVPTDVVQRTFKAF